jgi:hypothetical protein
LLLLVGQVGKCGVECRTIEKAADRVMGEHDTDVAEVLFTVSLATGDFRRLQGDGCICH